MKNIFILAITLCCFYNANGQNTVNNPEQPGDIFRKEWVGRANFMGLLDNFDRNISVGAEYRFHSYWAAGSDAAYIFQSDYISQHQGVRGVLLRPFIRYYFTPSKGGFLEAHLHFKSVSYQVKDWIGRDVSDGVAAYEQMADFRYSKTIKGIGIIIGEKFNLTSKNKNLKIEPYAGLGVRLKKQGSSQGRYRPDDDIFIMMFEPKYNFTALIMGMRLSFLL